MTLDQLRIFVAVAETLNMRQAADVLHLTQPSISAAIAALEERYGVRLFHRVGRGLELSEAGLRFLPEARGVLLKARDAASHLDDLVGLRRGTLRLIASQTVASYWMPTRMARFAETWSNISLSLSVSNTQQAIEAVLAGSADLGFVEGQVDDPLLERQIIGADRLGLYARPDHPLVGLQLTTDDLRSAAWVLREQGSGTRAHFMDALALVGLGVEDIMMRLELPSNEAALEALSGGGLVTAISQLAAAARIASGQIAELHWPFPKRDFTVVRHRSRHMSHAAKAFVQLMRPTNPLSREAKDAE